MGNPSRFIGLFLLLLLPRPLDAQEVEYKFEPATTTLPGRIIFNDYFGRPNYGENPRTDAVETAIILVLYEPINVRASQDDPLNSEPAKDIQRIQLVIPSEKLQGKEIEGRNVTVTGSLFSAHTSHHRTPVLMAVESLKIQDIVYPDFPWKNGPAFDEEFFFKKGQPEPIQNRIDIVSLYEEHANVPVGIYGVGETLLRKRLLHSIEDKKEIGEFFKIIQSSEPHTPEYSTCPLLEGQKEIHVIAFDYSHEQAGYLVIYFCKEANRTSAILAEALGNVALPVSKSFELADFLEKIGIGPE